MPFLVEGLVFSQDTCYRTQHLHTHTPSAFNLIYKVGIYKITSYNYNLMAGEKQISEANNKVKALKIII